MKVPSLLVRLGWMLIALAACTAGCERRPSVVLIGHVAALSGPDRESGLASLRGAQIAADEVNAEPEQWVNGHRIAVIHADSKGDPIVGENQAVRLAAVNKVAALVGGDTLEHARRLAAVAREYGLTLVTPSGLAGRGTGTIALGLSMDQRIEAITKLIADEPKSVRVVLVVNDQDATMNRAADQLAASLELHATDRHVRAISPAAVLDNPGVLDDAVVVVFGPFQGLKEIAATSAKPRLLIFAGDDFTSQVNLGESGVKSCLLLSDVPAQPQTEAAKAFWERYRKQFGTEPSREASRTYDAVKFLCGIAREARSLSPEKIGLKLATSRQGDRLHGPFTLSKENVARGPVFILRWQNGQSSDYKQFDLNFDK